MAFFPKLAPLERPFWGLFCFFLLFFAQGAPFSQKPSYIPSWNNPVVSFAGFGIEEET